MNDSKRLDWLIDNDAEICTPPNKQHKDHKKCWWIKAHVGYFKFKDTAIFKDPREAIDSAVKGEWL